MQHSPPVKSTSIRLEMNRQHRDLSARQFARYRWRRRNMPKQPAGITHDLAAPARYLDEAQIEPPLGVDNCRAQARPVCIRHLNMTFS